MAGIKNENLIDELAEKLAGSTKIESKISFKDKQLAILEAEDAKPVVEALESAESVEALELSGNTLGINGAQAIAVALEKRPEFKKSLCDSMMKAGARLVELDLSDNAFGPNVAVALEEFFRSPSVYSLQILKLNNNGLGPTGGPMIANSLSKCYDGSIKAGTPLSIKVFVSGRGRLENVGAKAFSEVFAKMGSLEEVVMPQNGIYYDGIECLARAFTKNVNLKIVNLEDNTFTYRGAKALAHVLPKLEKLEVLNLNDCLCKTRGVELLLNALKKKCNLRELHLNGNEIPVRVGLNILEWLKRQKTLKKLELCCNNFGAGRPSLIQLSQNCGGVDVDLGDESDDQGSPDEDEASVSGDEGEEENGEVYDSEGEWIDEEEDVEEDGILSVSPPKLEIEPEFQTGFRGDVQRILTDLGDDFNDPDAVSRCFIEISSTVTRRNENRNLELAQQCCDAVMKKAFHNVKPSSMLVNCLIARMGLIKCEEGRSAPSNLYGPLRVMEFIVSRPYFTKSSCDVLAFILKNSKHPFHGIEDARKKLEDVLETRK